MVEVTETKESEHINYPQGRVTDHRIGLTLHRLDSIIDGDLDEIMDALITTEQAEKLKAGDEAM